MSENRINAVTGRRELKIEPDGLPAIWVDFENGFCARCRPFNECLSFDEIDKESWEKLNVLIESINEGKDVRNEPSPKTY